MKIHALLPRLVSGLRAQTGIGLFLDYDGTLRDFVDDPEHALPDAELLCLLRDLAAHKWIRVCLVSGRSRQFLESHFAALGVTLVSEHGHRYLVRGDGEWKPLNENVNLEWKAEVRDALKRAADSCPGTHVEEKESALVWHFRKAVSMDPKCATALVSTLSSIEMREPITVQHGQKIIEVSSSEVNKGMAVEFLLGRWESSVALAAGDDRSDENMFSISPIGIEFHSVKVGPGPTAASHRTDIIGLRRFLEALRSESAHI